MKISRTVFNKSAKGSPQKIYQIKHDMAGRLRLSFSKKTFLSSSATAIQGLTGITSTRLNSSCKSLILTYDSRQLSKQSIFESIEKALSIPQSPVLQEPEKSLSACACAVPQAPQASKKNFVRFLGLTGVMGYVFTREVLLKATLAQAAFSPLGIVSLLASFPLLKEAYSHLKEKRFTLEGFLGAGCVAATFSGQAVTALEILWIQSGAESLNSWIAERSRQSVSNILDLTAKNTYIMAGGVEVEIPVSGVKPRDIVVLHTGEKICVDGEVVSGEALVDDSPITGRAEQVFVTTGTRVFAGSYVRHGVIHVRAECVGDKTYLARIMHQVEGSIENRAPIESVADRLARNLMRYGTIATVGTFLLTGSLWRAFTVMLVMACPCSTVLSAKTSVSAAMSAAAKRGILIKGGRYLEEMGQSDVYCFDKTGTLTTNQPRIEKIINYSKHTEDELLRWAYSAELHNHHPLALAIKHEAEARQLDPLLHMECNFTLGRGVSATIDDEVFRIGNRRFMQENDIGTEADFKKALPMRNKGFTVVFLARNTDILAAFCFANEARADALQTLQALRSTGVHEVIMITGDSEKTALAFCETMGIEECHHSVLPEEKGRIVSEIRAQKKKVVMVGDGINDALALAEADIGIAMSASGSDIAIEAADVALVSDNLDDILYLRDLSLQTVNIAHQNFWLATSTNIGGAVLGAMGILSPVGAGLIHIVHTLGVLANSSRLLWFEQKSGQPRRLKTSTRTPLLGGSSLKKDEQKKQVVVLEAVVENL